MPLIELRLTAGIRHADDLVVSIQDQTFDYLMTTSAIDVRVSAYFERDWGQVESHYAELFVNEDCPSRYSITNIIPGSKSRRGLTLPGAMKTGEQLTLQVVRVDAGVESSTDLSISAKK